MSGVNPQGCQAFSFKQPSADELEHDFLWRTTRCLPERGHIGIFNRSYYEEVLVVRQRKRFLERIDDPDKNWKFSLADIHERKYWKQYMEAYEACLSATSSHHAPWYVVPADDKENARLIVSQIVPDALNELKMAYPRTTAKRRRELESIRKLLVK
jgi:polyphosphate kinase 2 (PPK2 family)